MAKNQGLLHTAKLLLLKLDEEEVFQMFLEGKGSGSSFQLPG